MDISQAGLNLIKKWEGFYPHAYDDGEGVWTVGYGTIRWDMKTPVRKGETITREEAERQLLKEVQRVEDAIDATVKVPLTQPEFDALCSLFYNIGIGWCTGSGHAQATLIKRLNKGDKNIGSEFLKFVRGANSGKAYQGLLNRRRDEVRLWLAPVEEHAQTAALAQAATSTAPHEGDVPPEKPMPQAVAPAPGSMAQAAKESWTIRSAAAALGGALYQAWEHIFAVAKDAGAEAADITKAATPFEALFTALKANSSAIATGVVVIACAVVIARRLQAAREGRIG